MKNNQESVRALRAGCSGAIFGRPFSRQPSRFPISFFPIRAFSSACGQLISEKLLPRRAYNLKYFKTFTALRESILAAFGKYMSNVAEVIRVMKKLRSSAELQLLVDSFSGK